MEIWLEDVAEQLGLARIFRDSNTISGNRLAMILVDNVVEFVIKVRGEAIIPGQGKVLSRKEWEEEKRHFEKLVALVLPRTPITSLQQQILDYHSLRNSLYHSTVPLSVDPSKIDGYSNVARDFLAKVFNFAPSEEEWENRVKSAQAKLLPSSHKTSLVFFSKAEDGVVKFETSSAVKDSEAIRLVMHGFMSNFGRAPTFEELSKSLNYSGHSIKKSNLKVQISRLRKRGRVERREYSLTSNGRKRLTAKFGLI